MNDRTPDRESLIELATGAFRERDRAGRIQPSPAWQDLPDADREQTFDRQVVSRELERALSEDGLSTTAREVLGRARRIEQS